MLLFGSPYIGLRGPLILYLKSLSPNSALVHNYSHYEPVPQWAFHKRAVSVSVALNANEEERGGSRWRVEMWPWAAEHALSTNLQKWRELAKECVNLRKIQLFNDFHVCELNATFFNFLLRCMWLFCNENGGIMKSCKPCIFLRGNLQFMRWKWGIFGKNAALAWICRLWLIMRWINAIA